MNLRIKLVVLPLVLTIFLFSTKSSNGAGVHPSLHPNCHHQIDYSKFKLKVYYPPPYDREVWHYQHPKSNAVQKQSQFFLGKWHL